MDYHKVFLEILNDYRENYSYLCFKKYSIDYMIEKYSNFMKTVKTESVFIRTLANILTLFEDGHIVLYDSHNHPHLTYNKKQDINYNLKLTYNKYLKEDIKFHNSVGLIAFCGDKKDILYINVYTWDYKKGLQLNKLLHMIGFYITNYPNINKLIIDVRSNGGGSDGFAKHLLSFFIPKGKKLFVSKYLYRLNKNNPHKLGKEHKSYVPSNHQDIYFNGKIIVLIGNHCMSSNEYFCMGLEALKYSDTFSFHKRITFVGDKTFGSSGNPELFKNNTSGISYMIPSWVCYTSRGKLLEGTGIYPDIHIKSNHTISWNKDKAFLKALYLLE